jgi:hypothetical protein
MSSFCMCLLGNGSHLSHSTTMLVKVCGFVPHETRCDLWWQLSQFPGSQSISNYHINKCSNFKSHVKTCVNILPFFVKFISQSLILTVWWTSLDQYNNLVQFGVLMKLVRLIKMCLKKNYSKVQTFFCLWFSPMIWKMSLGRSRKTRWD